MATSDGWYLIALLLAVAVVAFLGVVFRRRGLSPTYACDDDPLRDLYGLAIFAEPEDYGLLRPAAVTDEPDVADGIRAMLAGAGIRATRATRGDGRTVVLVFAEQVEAARRLVGDSPVL